MSNERQKGFHQAVGKWLGTAEVYGGNGRFLGNATDRRHVQQQVDSDTVRIDLSFVGPFKFAGHYHIKDCKTHRLYQGPANVGYAETLSANLIDANAYWAVTGLSQRFFLMIAPDGKSQMSLGLMSRGEQLIYVVIGEYVRVEDGEYAGIPALQNGTSYDLQNDPTAGRGELLLHRSGVWQGELATLDGDLNELPATSYRERVQAAGGEWQVASSRLRVTVEGTAFDPESRQMNLTTNQWQAWTAQDDEIAGCYSLSGGRALSGNFHHLDQNLRVWRREVVSHDGENKAVVHCWYRGGARVGVQFGLLRFFDTEDTEVL